MDASFYHAINPSTNTALGVDISRKFSTDETTITLGAQHALNPLTTVKARITNSLKASALIQHKWRLKSLLTISGEVDIRAIERSPKVGLGLVLNL
jgi:voltage-dependent anion channel protein 2